MKKIIKLKESDIEIIVKRVLSEQGNMFGTAGLGTDSAISSNRKTTPSQKVDINPKKLKMGDGGKSKPKQIADVKALQQKLMDLKLLKTDTMVPTGYFGSLTQKALDAYNGDKSVVSSQSKVDQPEKEDSWTDKVKKFCLSPLKGLESLKNSFSLASLNPLPPHWRAFMSFLLGRTKPINADFFKPEELKLIADRVNSYFPSDSKCRKNKKCYVSFYQNTDWSKVKTGQEKVLNPELGKAIGLTIGNGQVIDNGSSYIVKDIYDFNNFKNNPSAYSPEKAGSTVKAALIKITCGNYIQGIEELASFKQAKGYKGIPVEIEIPKTV